MPNYNHYKLSSDEENYLRIEPTEGNGDTLIKLKALGKPDGIFDYETANGPIIITVSLLWCLS